MQQPTGRFRGCHFYAYHSSPERRRGQANGDGSERYARGSHEVTFNVYTISFF